MKPEVTETETRSLRRIPALVDDTGRAVVQRAVTLRLATLACTESDDQELHGAALVHICKTWMEAESERLRAVRG